MGPRQVHLIHFFYEFLFFKTVYDWICVHIYECVVFVSLLVLSWSVDWIPRARLKFLKEWLSFVHALKVTWRFTKKIKRKNAKQFRIVFEFLPLFSLSIYEWFSSFADVQVALKYILSHTTWRIRCCCCCCRLFFLLSLNFFFFSFFFQTHLHMHEQTSDCIEPS